MRRTARQDAPPPRGALANARITWRLLAIRDSYSDFNGRRLGRVPADPQIKSQSQISGLAEGADAGMYLDQQCNPAKLA